jgi:hypothetical protein
MAHLAPCAGIRRSSENRDPLRRTVPSLTEAISGERIGRSKAIVAS